MIESGDYVRVAEEFLMVVVKMILPTSLLDKKMENRNVRRIPARVARLREICFLLAVQLQGTGGEDDVLPAFQNGQQGLISQSIYYSVISSNEVTTHR